MEARRQLPRILARARDHVCHGRAPLLRLRAAIPKKDWLIDAATYSTSADFFGSAIRGFHNTRTTACHHREAEPSESRSHETR
jgi:hypothetical protein